MLGIVAGRKGVVNAAGGAGRAAVGRREGGDVGRSKSRSKMLMMSMLVDDLLIMSAFGWRGSKALKHAAARHQTMALGVS
jgi:hypothetical protein